MTGLLKALGDFFKGQKESKFESINPINSEDWIDEIFKKSEEQDRRWQERFIEMNRIKHRFDKLKAPKPRWIHG